MTEDQRKALEGIVKATAFRYWKLVSGFFEQQDLEQELWLVCIPYIETFDPTKNATLVTFVRNRLEDRCKDFLRKNKKRLVEVSFDAPKDAGANDDDAGDTLHDDIRVAAPARQEDAVDLMRIDEALSRKLSQGLIDMLKLRAKGFSYEEIANLTNSDGEAVKKAVSRAQAKISKKKAA